MYTKNMCSTEVLPCTPTFPSYTMLRSIEVLPYIPAAHAWYRSASMYAPQSQLKQLPRSTEVLPCTPAAHTWYISASLYVP